MPDERPLTLMLRRCCMTEVKMRENKAYAAPEAFGFQLRVASVAGRSAPRHGSSVDTGVNAHVSGGGEGSSIEGEEPGSGSSPFAIPQ